MIGWLRTRIRRKRWRLTRRIAALEREVARLRADGRRDTDAIERLRLSVVALDLRLDREADTASKTAAALARTIVSETRNAPLGRAPD